MWYSLKRFNTQSFSCGPWGYFSSVMNLPEGAQIQVAWTYNVLKWYAVKNWGHIYILNGSVYSCSYFVSVTTYQMEEEACRQASNECLSLAERPLILLLISFNHVYEGAVQWGWPAVKWDLTHVCVHVRMSVFQWTGALCSKWVREDLMGERSTHTDYN